MPMNGRRAQFARSTYSSALKPAIESGLCFRPVLTQCALEQPAFSATGVQHARHRCHAHQRQHELANEGAVKHPQVRQVILRVVLGAAQHRVDRVAPCALEPVPVQQAVCPHVADRRLDDLPPFEQLLQVLRQAPSVADRQPRACA